MQRITMNDIISGSDIANNLWQFELKHSVGCNTNNHILLDFDEHIYQAYLMRRNRKGTTVIVVLEKEL